WVWSTWYLALVPERSATEGVLVPYQRVVDQTQSTRLRYQSLPENKGKPSHEGEEMDEEPQVSGIAETHHQSPPPQADKPQSSHALSTKASDTNSSSDDIFKKYDNILPLTKRRLVKYLRKMSDELFTRISEDNWKKREEAATVKLVEASMSSLDKSNNTINDLYKGLNFIIDLLKEIKNAIKDDSVINKKITEATESFTKGNTTNIATEEPPSHIEAETGEPKRAIPISTIQPTDVPPTQAQPITTIITHPESSQAISRSDKGKGLQLKVYHLTAEQLQEPMDKEELIKKVEEEARILSIYMPKVIKVVQEEAEKIGLDPKKITSAKACKKFKKAQDAEHQPETNTDIKIHPKTKPVVITVYRVVHDLMNSLSRRYKRIRTILEELGIKSTLPAPAPAPEQASSQSLRKKRKHMELEPETKIPGLECNRTLPKNVSFVNNMVIEEPEHGIFFTDEFCDQAFQRWSDLDKVGIEVLVSYLVDAFMVKSPENVRFNLKLKKLIAEHPDQKKLKSKKVKLEALRYEMN
nr:hypothetical protein [Tanacetum cinerariifolium]